MRIFFALLALSAMTTAAFADEDRKRLDAPPAVVATSMQLSTLLAAHAAAVGKAPPHALNTAREQWTFRDSGVDGTLSLVRSGTDYHSTIVTGPFTEQYGQQSGKRWYQNRNGLTTSTQDKEERSFYTARILEDAADPKNDARVIGETQGTNPAYVVEVKVTHAKHPEWIFYDKSTSLVSRVESTVGNKYRIISTYSDYRKTLGVNRPWYITDTYPDKYAYLNDDYTLTGLRMGEPASAAEFTAPPDRRSLFQSLPADSMALPVKVIGNYVIVRVVIKGRGLDFELVSGSNDITIDRDVAAELNLPTYGQPTQTADGRPRGYVTKADVFVGDLQMPDIALYATRFNYKMDDGVKVVGQLGYDFLKDLALKVDYVNRSVTAINPKKFDKFSDPLTWMMPLRIEDGLPFIHAKIGDTVADRMIFDNAEPYVILFGGFTVPHRDDVKDIGKHTVHVLPLSQDDTIGYAIESGVTQPAHFIFGPADYGSFSVIFTTIPWDIGDEEIDGIVGEPFIHFYDVTFDYPHNCIWLKPNEWFFRYFAKNKS